jgi:APA family basic amino acid/polyamine antiporter
VIVGGVLTGMVPYTDLANTADPLSYALQTAGFTRVGWIVALGAAVSMSAVLLVFQYGQPRIFFAMARDGLLPQWAAKLHPISRVPYSTTLITGIGVALASLVGDAAETYDLTNIGTLFAFVIVCLAVLIMRKMHPEAERPFRCPGVPFVPILGILSCLMLMFSLPADNWWRLAVWLVIGLLLYFLYGRHHSVVAREAARHA